RHVDHTAAEPPNHGKIRFATSGSTMKSKKALSEIAVAVHTPKAFFRGTVIMYFVACKNERD
ncbi:MAG TPA: hypothetical protein VE086_05490, partial [Chthoniobacterales bacterium]|nr:hypothetical protein [Chthoniobacterales bacterium]